MYFSATHLGLRLEGISFFCGEHHHGVMHETHSADEGSSGDEVENYNPNVDLMLREVTDKGHQKERKEQVELSIAQSLMSSSRMGLKKSRKKL